MSALDKARRLQQHRELQLLRASSVRTVGGRKWVHTRSVKLAEARALVERLERACQRWASASHEPHEVCPHCGRYALRHEGGAA